MGLSLPVPTSQIKSRNSYMVLTHQPPYASQAGAPPKLVATSFNSEKHDNSRCDKNITANENNPGNKNSRIEKRIAPSLNDHSYLRAYAKSNLESTNAG